MKLAAVILILVLISPRSLFAEELLQFESFDQDQEVCVNLANDLSSSVSVLEDTIPQLHLAGAPYELSFNLRKSSPLDTQSWIVEYSGIYLNSIISNPYEKFIHHQPSPSLKDFFFSNGTEEVFAISTPIAANIGGTATLEMSLVLYAQNFTSCLLTAQFIKPTEFVSQSPDITPPLVRAISYDQISYQAGQTVTVTLRFSERLKLLETDHLEFVNASIPSSEPSSSVPEFDSETSHRLRKIDQFTYQVSFLLPGFMEDGAYILSYFNRIDSFDNFEDAVGKNDFIESQIANSSPLIIANTDFSRVDTDIERFRISIDQKKEIFNRIPEAPTDIEWVKQKLRHLYDIDQYTREFLKTPIRQNYFADEISYFNTVFFPLMVSVDLENSEDIKTLILLWDWFTISKFGQIADSDAWLIVQHADRDTALQSQTLTKLERLYPQDETDPKNYAFLHDRIAASWHDDSKRQPQRYGTQGQCISPGRWEPIPLESPELVDQRRLEVGLDTMEENIIRMNAVCNQ